MEFLQAKHRRQWVRVHLWDRNYGTGEGNNRIVPLCRGEIIMKFDEDAVIRSPEFFEHVVAIHKLVPTAVFSPYPVGLIRHVGGDKALGHLVKYSSETDTYYTLRTVEHVGGMSRIAPSSVAKAIRCPFDLDENSGREDDSFAEACMAQQVPTYYLENAIIVEHQESTLGQMERFPQYFAKRTDFKPNHSSRFRSLLGRLLKT
jgi:hypothetical protein